MQDIQYLTDKGAKKLETRLSYLKQERLPQLIVQIREIAEEGGGFDESPEYASLKDEQSLVEAEIDRLESLLRSSYPLELPKNTRDVRIGSQVTIIEKGAVQEEIYQLLSSAEANPREGRISIESPLGHALLGAKVGDEIKVQAPDGELVFIVKATR